MLETRPPAVVSAALWRTGPGETSLLPLEWCSDGYACTAVSVTGLHDLPSMIFCSSITSPHSPVKVGLGTLA